MTDAAGTVYLQVGAASGAMTEIQRTLWAHRTPLQKAGLLYARGYPMEDVHASASLRRDEAILRAMPRAIGAWERVAARARDWAGHSVISHGSLALASDEHLNDAARSLRPAEMHVVYTAMDLLSQVYAQWHQLLISGAHQSFGGFVDTLMRNADDSGTDPSGSVLDPEGVLARWSAVVPAERIHVIVTATATATHRYSSPWPLFCRVVGLDASLASSLRPIPVTWLEQGDAEILRRVNSALAGRLQRPAYDRAVRGVFTGTVLRTSPRVMHPPRLSTDVLSRLAARADRTVSSLSAAGYHIVGDLDDLRPAPYGDEEPATVTEPDVSLDRVLKVNAQLIERMRDARSRSERAEQAIADLREESDAIE